jgi:hypothetical protein
MVHYRHFTSLAAVGLVAVLAAPAARASDVTYFGRWTVSDEKPDYSTKGLLYKTIDIAPCGNDFCGVSVDDKNGCGPTLFRFFTAHAKDDELIGHGKWGSLKKKVQINYATPTGEKPYFSLGLGDDNMDVTGREGSIPTFEANYAYVGPTQCSAK